MSTTARGDLAELLAAAELVSRGYIVSRPLTHDAPYDLIVDSGGALFRVQIKRASRSRTGAYRFVLRSSKQHRKRSDVSYFGRVDCVLLVDCESHEFFAVGGDDLKHHELHVRAVPAKNAQRARVRSAADYGIDEAFPRLVGLVGGTGIEPVAPAV